MSTDSELLEAAAKAAGMETKWDQPRGAKTGHLRARLLGEMAFPIWNPLQDDGEALRLAVKLRLWLRYRDDKSVNACWYDERGIFAGNVTEEFGSLRNGPDPSAATRRAIVRAAAAIGGAA